VESPTGIIPEELMYPERKRDMVRFLLSQPLPSWVKRRLAEGWCITVGCRLRSREYHLLEVSGTDKSIPLGG
jgi:hypothetical protein